MKKSNALGSSSGQIKAGAITSYLVIAFNIISGLLFTPWMVRQIGQSDYGLYTLVVSLISFFAIDFGLGSSVSRFLSRYKATGDECGAKKFLGIVYQIFIIIAFIIFLVLIAVYFSIEYIYRELTYEEISKLKEVFLVLSVFCTVSFPFKALDGILIANERFVFTKLTDLLSKVLILLFMFGALYLGYKLYAVVLINALIGLLLIIIKFIYIKRYTSTKVHFFHNEKAILKDIFSFSAWSTIIGIAQRFIINITPSILGVTSGSAEIAIFSIGMTIEGYTWTISNALGGLFLPKVTRMMVHNDDIQEIENLMIRVGRIQLLIVGLIVAGFASMGHEFIRLWMGKSFSDSYYVALFLILPTIVSFTQEIAYTALVALNQLKYRAIASMIVAGISFLLSLWFSRMYGAIGSALAIFLGNIVGLVIIMNIMFWKILKINVTRFFIECHLKMVIPGFLTYTTGLILQYLTPVDTLFLFVCKVCLVALFYGLFVWIFFINEYEKDLFLGTLKNIFNRFAIKRY
ncbi:oligosaccharide flippase family protein [Heliobacterium chlorum]|uniref:Oligosaccharide flippase family protein n=1 Tax=Heliobacterium chlorum TaxID=2698 RepID=A0ABR7T739_HELCL|nr:oligosaccharide flippase family protein [Heliobacterium chlorum]MBC9785828.1 oligosaccharide flippase family protein [Heliobacterium chlorum]